MDVSSANPQKAVLAVGPALDSEISPLLEHLKAL